MSYDLMMGNLSPLFSACQTVDDVISLAKELGLELGDGDLVAIVSSLAR